MSAPTTGTEPSTTTLIATAIAEEKADRGGVLGYLRRSLQQALAFVTLIILLIFFTIAAPNFATYSNISTILLQTAVVGILALGTTFVIITGGIDLSLGFGMTLCAVMTGVFVTQLGLPVGIGVILGILTGAFIGLVNGTGVAILGLPPFIATLAMMMVTQGLALIVSGVRPIYFSGTPEFKQIALGSLWQGGLPNAVLIMLALAVVAYLLLSKTLLGRYTFAIGSNEEATRLSGINTRRWKLVIYTVAGAFTGIAGVVMASRLDSAQPQLGSGYELQAIAAVIIGGTSLLGGRGSIIGTLIGALIMNVLLNGLRMMSVQTEWQFVVTGVVVFIAVYVDSLRNRRTT